MDDGQIRGPHVQVFVRGVEEAATLNQSQQYYAISENAVVLYLHDFVIRECNAGLQTVCRAGVHARTSFTNDYPLKKDSALTSMRSHCQDYCRRTARNARSNPPMDFSMRSSGMVSDRRM